MTAFDELYAMYKTPIYRFACALSGDPRDAEDLFQETWLRAVKAAPARPATPGAEAKAWLYAIAANAHKDLLRRRRVRRLFLAERASALGDRKGDADLGWDIPALAGEDGASQSDIRICLRRAVSRLPGKERRVFVLKDIEGFRHDEIGRLLGMPEATVRTLLFRAVKRLRRDLAEFRPAGNGRPAFGEGRT
ncbi:MAG TPA: sigma-70 family RNA polymerase sigma factor [Acidobacteriota bacterium]|nr:sigma-70 family RNA polymerase sigma factor [Acidobacteriota bacterium]